MSFKGFFLEGKSPDNIYVGECRSFLFAKDFIAYFKNNDMGTHYDLMKALKKKFINSNEKAEWFKDLAFRGTPPRILLKYLEENTGVGRDSFVKQVGILGRIRLDMSVGDSIGHSGKKHQIAFWNPITEFGPEQKKQTLTIFKIFKADPKVFEFNFYKDYNAKEYSYEQFMAANTVPVEEPKPIENKPKQNLDEIVHMVDPAKKGAVMKDMGMKPKAAMGAEKRFLMGETFKLHLEANQEFVDKIQDAIDKVAERPFKELFGDKQRFMIPVYNPEFLKNAEKIGMDLDEYSPEKRTYKGHNINTWLKKRYELYKGRKNDEELEKYRKELVDAFFEGKGKALYNYAQRALKENKAKIEFHAAFPDTLSIYSDNGAYMGRFKKSDMMKDLGMPQSGESFDTEKPEQIARFLMGAVKGFYRFTGKGFSNYFNEFIDQVNYRINAPYDEKLKVMTEPMRSVKNVKQAIDQRNVNYYLLFSRHPIDVLRMSDHKGISSCHRLGGGKYSSDDGPYKRCALADARNDGGIVYLVKGNAINILKGKLDENDIFEDKDRNVGYLRPLGRIRLRRFIDLKTGYDFAVPTLLQDEQKYGLFTPKLHEQVMDYVRQHQSIYENPPSPIYTRDNIVMLGGSYSDENLNDLFNNFFENKNRSFVKYKSDQVKHKTENVIGWDDEIANIKEEHQDRYKAVKFNMFIVQEGGGRKVRTEYILEQKIHPDFQRYLFDPAFVHKVTLNVTKTLLSNTFNSYGEYADGVLTMTGWRIDDDPDTARGALNYLDSLDSMLTRTQNLFEAKFIYPLVKKN